MFIPFGPVSSAQVVMDLANGHSKGFGFVEMTDNQDARRAIRSLDDSTLNGRAVLVNQASLR